MNIFRKTKSAFSILLIIMPVVLFTAGFIGCKGGGEDVDTTPPEIISRSPGNDGTDIPLNSLITFTFNKDVSGVSQSSVILNAINYPNVPVNVDITYNASTRTVTVDPKNDLFIDCTYVVAVTSDIVSGSGIPFPAESWVFSTGQALDTVSPKLTEVSPASDASYVDVETSIKVTFSEAVLSSSLNADSIVNGSLVPGTFRLKNLKTSQYVFCTIEYNVGSYTATLDPVDDLSDWVNYQVEVTSGVTDAAGNALTGTGGLPLVYAFMSEDENPPVVKNATPSDGSTVARSAQISVTFSESLSQSTVESPANFYLVNDSTGQSVAATRAYDDNAKKVILSPSAMLEESTEYNVYLTAGITDLAGNALSANSWSFTTNTDSTDTVAPTVLGTMTPQPDAVNVDPDTSVTVMFSESVSGVTDTTFTLTKSGSSVPVEAKVVYSDSTRTATLSPKSTLDQMAVYTVLLSSAIQDVSANALIERSWSFTTKDNTKPLILEKIPGVESNVALASPVYVRFSESMQSATVTDTANFKVENITDSENVTGTLSYTNSNFSATFTPSSGLDYAHTYKVTISNAKDIAGNTIAASTWTFVTLTEPDTTAPFVESRSTDLNNGSIGISSSMQFMLSETVAANCINANTVRLHIGGGTSGAVVDSSVSYNAGSRQVTILPDAKLMYNQQYTVEVRGNVAGSLIQDLSGNQLANDSWTFTTETDSVHPTVVYKTPENGTSGIPGNGVQIDVGFSEAVTGVSASSFYIEHAATAYKPGVVVTDISNPAINDYKYRLTLSSVIENTDTGDYVIVLTSAIKDSANNAVTFTADSWVINVTGKDITAPTVTLKDPNPAISQIWRRSSGIYTTRVIFSENVNNVDSSSFKLERKTGPTTYEDVPCNFGYETGTRTATLAVDAEYTTSNNNLYDTTFRVTLGTTIADTAGNTFAGDIWNITTDTDTDPPTVINVSPSNNAGGVPYNNSGKGPTLSVTFSEAMKASSITDATFYLTKQGESTHVASTITIDGNIATLTPDAPLAGSSLSTTQYYVATVTTGVTDAATTPNNLASNKTWTFSTSTETDSIKPYIEAITPSNGSSSQGQFPTCTVRFSEKLSNATASYIWLANSSGSVVSSTLTYDSSTSTATLVPNTQLTGGSTYYIVCSQYLTDLSSNSLDVVTNAGLFTVNASGNPQSSFGTAADTTGPTCNGATTSSSAGYISYLDGSAATTWTSGATITLLNPQFTVAFSEAASNVSTSTITLKRGATTVPVYVTYDSTVNKAYIQLKTDGSEVVNGALKTSTTYTMTVLSTIIDVNSNGLNKVGAVSASDTVISFVTPAALPKITNVSFGGTNYVNSTTAVPNNPSSIAITFNAAMNTSKAWFELYTADTQAGHAIPVTIGERTWSSGNTIVAFPVVGAFKGNTTYYLRMYGWAGTFEDIHGNTVDKTQYVTSGVLTFLTAADGASTPPTLSSSSPANGTSAGTSLPVVVLNFSEPMDTATAGTVSFTAGAGTLTLAGWQNSGRTAVYSVSGLDAVSHTVSYSGFKDLSGNTITGGTFSFSVTSYAADPVASSSEDFDTGGFSNYANVASDSSYLNGSTSVGCNWSAVTYGYFQSAASTWFTAVNGSYLSLGADCVWDYGNYADLVSNSSFNLSSSGTYLLSFSMAHSAEYNQSDRVAVEVSTDGGSSYQAAGTVYRFDNGIAISPASPNDRWKTHYVDLTSIPLSDRGAVKVRLRAYSAGETGANVYIDKLAVTRY